MKGSINISREELALKRIDLNSIFTEYEQLNECHIYLVNDISIKLIQDNRESFEGKLIQSDEETEVTFLLWFWRLNDGCFRTQDIGIQYYSNDLFNLELNSSSEIEEIEIFFTGRRESKFLASQFYKTQAIFDQENFEIELIGLIQDIVRDGNVINARVFNSTGSIRIRFDIEKLNAYSVNNGSKVKLKGYGEQISSKSEVYISVSSLEIIE